MICPTFDVCKELPALQPLLLPLAPVCRKAAWERVLGSALLAQQGSYERYGLAVQQQGNVTRQTVSVESTSYVVM